MTTTPYGPATRPAPSTGRTALKVVLAIELVLGLTACAATAAFIGAITYSGCFIGCDAESADETGGLLLYALAVVLLVSGPVLARVMWRSRDGLTTWAAVLLGLPALLWCAGSLQGVL